MPAASSANAGNQRQERNRPARKNTASEASARFTLKLKWWKRVSSMSAASTATDRNDVTRSDGNGMGVLREVVVLFPVQPPARDDRVQLPHAVGKRRRAGLEDVW